jgi:hypothetical protein
MKKVFIPSGETVMYNSLNTDKIVVKGTLRVRGKLMAKEIIGGGTVEAAEIVCDDLRVSCATADFITAKRIAADKLFIRFECRASEQLAVRDYLNAGYVSTGTLTVTLSDVGSCDADKVIMVRRRGSLLGLLWASWWRGLFLDMFHGGKAESSASESKETPVPAREEPAALPYSGKASNLPGTPGDDTIGLMITVLTDLRDKGYRVSRVNAAGGNEDAA